ncbi:MAG TPA: enoyl-CoA hydratase-related protein, partial [Chloroflexota bacterium]|nr:enoyl-CoA hydratase-related protein [Chloroflexota bacterium]
GAVNGYAVGGGLELALACDVIVAAEHAQFGLPEPRRGLIAGAGGVHRLLRQVPWKLAMGLIVTGKLISAAEAYRIGLVNEVVPKTDLSAAVDRWVGDILAAAPLAVQASKQAALDGADWPLEIAMSRSYPLQQQLRESEDFLEGPRAFAAKRKPRWQGH